MHTCNYNNICIYDIALTSDHTFDFVAYSHQFLELELFPLYAILDATYMCGRVKQHSQTTNTTQNKLYVILIFLYIVTFRPVGRR